MATWKLIFSAFQQRAHAHNKSAGSLRFFLTLHLFIVCFCAFERSCSADDAVLKGTMYYEAYMPSGKLFYNDHWDFVCRASLPLATNWNIRLLDTNPRSHFLYSEVGNAGDNIYRLKRTKPEVLRKELASNKRYANKFPIFGQGMIMPVPIPPSEPDSYVSPIWFAYASSYFISTNDSEKLRPIWTTPLDVFRSTNYEFRVFTRLTATHPPLPAETVFLSDGVYPAKSNENRTFLREYAPPYNHGFTNAIFSISGRTNLDQFYFPLSFRLKQFRPQPNGRSTLQTVLAAEWEGTISSCSVEPSIRHYKPQLPDDRVKFVDYRFSGKMTPELLT